MDAINQEEQFPPEARMLMYGMLSMYRLLSTCRDLRRGLQLASTGVTRLHPDEAEGFRHRYSILEQQLLSAEATARDICRHLQQALMMVEEDTVGLIVRTTPAVRGVWVKDCT